MPADLTPAPRDGRDWIIAIDEDYRHAVVGTPDQRFLYRLTQRRGSTPISIVTERPGPAASASTSIDSFPAAADGGGATAFFAAQCSNIGRCQPQKLSLDFLIAAAVRRKSPCAQVVIMLSGLLPNRCKGAWLAVWPALIVLANGCSRLPDAAYALRSESEKIDLPAKQAAQIAEYLAAFHGTPANPRMALPAADADFEVVKAGGISALPRSDKPGYERLHLQRGREVYTAQCAGCHGTTGDGKGPAGQYLNPPPRDYRNGVFKFTSTPRGSKPRRDDLHRILKYGAKGTSMPAFRFLSDEDTEAVIDYVQVLASRGQLEIDLIREAQDELDEEDDLDPETVAGFVTDIAASWDRAEGEIVRPLTVNPPRTPETVRAGAVAFAEFACVKCHGAEARGSRSADVGQDIWGRTAYPANLAMGMLHGGRRPVDIYRRIYSGINGTPMPSSKDPNTAINETPEQRSEKIWHLVHFVESIIESSEVPPAAQAAIHEALARSATP